MGQTLTHGVYLPDEGERNCYDGLAANWQLLDNSVGTIAEHTTALAGKAPLVHTHTKSDITDFPAYGTTAGTICEGNDSRLSDARTPVAHTHVTADVTDLLNSAHTWTDTQTYSAASYGQKILLKNTDLDLSVNGNTGLSSTYQHVISWVDKNNTTYSSIQSWTSSANNTLVLRSYYRTDANTSRNLSVRFVSTATDKSIYPETNADTDLGTSTNKWKSLNGINPGALSLPDTTREDPIDRTNWVYTYIAANVYYPPEDGWLVVACSGSDYMQIDGDAGWGITLSKGYDGFCTGIIPVKKNKRVQIRIRETSSGSVVVRRASFYPGTGDPSFTVS